MEKETVDSYIHQSKKLLFRTLNCCESQIIPFQNAHAMDSELLLKAITGLAGGLYNRGSTCGVVLGAALDLAMQADADLERWTPADEYAVLMQVSDYVKWFENKFEGCLCRDRTELDFQTIRGKVGLLIPQKARGCVKQSALSMKYLLTENLAGKPASKCPVYPHCATEVLRKVHGKTGIGDEGIEQLATVFDGGIGLSGGACGAVIGGLVALGFQHGYEHSKAEAFQMRDIFRTIPRKYARTANRFIDQFEAKYGSLECEGILQHKIQGFDDYVKQRDNCQPMIDWIAQRVAD